MKFGPDRRVRKRPEFQAIQRAGRRITSKHFVWIVSKSVAGDAPSRLGITASKKAGNSAVRSRLKRIVRAAFRAESGMLPEGYDLVVICRFYEPSLGTDTVVQEWRGVKSRVQKALTQLKSPSR